MRYLLQQSFKGGRVGAFNQIYTPKLRENVSEKTSKELNVTEKKMG